MEGLNGNIIEFYALKSMQVLLDKIPVSFMQRSDLKRWLENYKYTFQLTTRETPYYHYYSKTPQTDNSCMQVWAFCSLQGQLVRQKWGQNSLGPVQMQLIAKAVMHFCSNE